MDTDENRPAPVPGVTTGTREHVTPRQAAERRAFVRESIMDAIPPEVARLALKTEKGVDMTLGAFKRLWKEVLDQIKSEHEELGDASKAVWLAQVKEAASQAARSNQFAAVAKLRELQMKGEGHEQPRRVEINVTGQIQSSVMTFLGVVSEERLREIIEVERLKQVDTVGELSE